MNDLTTSIDRALYPFEPKRFATGDGAMSYVDVGRGPPVLLVHGTPSWSFEFREVITALSPKHRVIAPDHLGFGLSDKPEGAGYTPADHARRLLALVDALDLRDLTLVVHDFGGPIGLPVALDRSDRVTRVIVLNSWMWPNAEDASVQRIDRLVRSRLGRFLYFDLNISPTQILKSAFGDARRLTPALHAHYLAPFRRRETRASLYAMALALGGADPYYEGLWARRSALKGKLELVWGLSDPAFGLHHLARWKQAFSDAEVIELPGIGHFVAEEAPEAVVRAVDPSIVLAPRPPLPARAARWPWALAILALSIAAFIAFRGAT